MPELPEVEVLRRGLESYLVGSSIVAAEIRCSSLREKLDGDAVTSLAVGHRIEAVGRRAKYLLLDLEGPSTVVFHLGMSGRLSIVDPDRAPGRHEHVALLLSSGKSLRFTDPRRFGLLLVLESARVSSDRHFAHLGVEPLGPDFSGSFLRAKGSGRRAAVKSFLMDGRIVVGIGNIYATEALFEAGVHPLRAAGRISLRRWHRVADSVQQVLRRAIEQGGTTLNDFRDADGEEGYFQVSLSAYGREGKPCRRCGVDVRRIVVAGRSSFYCPHCQH